MRLRDLKVGHIHDAIKREHLTKNPKTPKETERNVIIEWLQSLPIKFHLTLTMSYGTSERDAVILMNELVKKLNIRIFGKRYTTHKTACLQGVVVMEDTPDMETVHFHILILDLPYVPTNCDLTDKINKVLVTDSHHYRQNKIMHFQLDDYYLSFDTSIERYVSKIYESNYDIQTIRDRFGFLGPDKVEFGGVNLRSRYSGGSSRYMPSFTAAA